jgi:tRNA pseudouridine55 synthase
VVAVLRGITGIRQIGHAGTLDPFATGLLVVGVGAATKQLDAVHVFDKEYVATIRFGATSDTDDCDGVITPFQSTLLAPGHSPTPLRPHALTRDVLEQTLSQFRGTIQQTPPMYSAKKKGGKKLYELAREGKTVTREPVSVTIHDIVIEDLTPETATLRITCSTGTYIRALARDIGTALQTGAYCAALRRTRIGPYRVEDAIEPKAFEKETWMERLREPKEFFE